jgi:hypothetical protein
MSTLSWSLMLKFVVIIVPGSRENARIILTKSEIKVSRASVTNGASLSNAS